MHVIRANRKNGETNPPITVKRGQRNTYARTVEIMGPSRLVYRPNKPLSCGARLWLETEALVLCDGDHESDFS